MTDFISELEAELLEAARRRAERGHRRLRWTPRRPRLAPLAAAAALVLVAVVVVMAVRGLDRSNPADEAPVPPGGGANVTLAAAVPGEACAGREPKALEAVPELHLTVMERAPDQPDEVPGDWFSRIPADVVYPKGSRLVGPGHFSMPIHLLPVDGLRADCDAPRGNASGVCLIAGSDDVRVRCFDDAAIGRGAAIALTGPGVAHGIVPDDVERVRVEWDGGSQSVGVMDNAYELRAPELREGDELRVQLEGPSRPACGPSTETMAAVPLLGTGSGAEPPAAVVEAMEQTGARGVWREYARSTEGAGGMQIWVAPDLPCDNPRVKAERVCMVLVRDGANRGFLCARPRAIAARGAWFPFPAEGAPRTGVAGMAPTGTAGMATVLRGEDSTPVPITAGVFAAVLPAGEGEIEIRFADGPDPTIFDGTGVDGLVDEIGERLPGGEVIRYTEREFERTTVYYGHEDARPVAEHVAGVLRVDRVEPMPDEIAGLAVGGGLAVVVGRDMLQPRAVDVGVLAAAGVSAEIADRLRERLALGSPLHLFPTDERRERSVVRFASGWERPAREIAARLGIDELEIAGEATPDERLGTPVVVVVGADLAQRLRGS